MNLSSVLDKMDEKHFILRDGLLFVLTVLIALIGWIGTNMYDELRGQAKSIRDLERTTIRQTIIQEEQKDRLVEIKNLLQQAANQRR